MREPSPFLLPLPTYPSPGTLEGILQMVASVRALGYCASGAIVVDDIPCPRGVLEHPCYREALHCFHVSGRWFDDDQHGRLSWRVPDEGKTLPLWPHCNQNPRICRRDRSRPCDQVHARHDRRETPTRVEKTRQWIQPEIHPR